MLKRAFFKSYPCILYSALCGEKIVLLDHSTINARSEVCKAWILRNSYISLHIGCFSSWNKENQAILRNIEQETNYNGNLYI